MTYHGFACATQSKTYSMFMLQAAANKKLLQSIRASRLTLSKKNKIKTVTLRLTSVTSNNVNQLGD